MPETLVRLQQGRHKADLQVDTALVGQLPKGYIHGCKLSWLSVSQIQIGTGLAINDDDSQNIAVSSQITIAITTSGKNGLDTGSEAANTWYYVFVIYNPTTLETAGILSASQTSPTLPSGFTKKRYLGAVRNNGSSNFYKFLQYRNFTSARYFYLEDADSVLRVLAGGTSTTFVDVNLNSFIPPTSTTADLVIECPVAQEGNVRPNGETMAGWQECAKTSIIRALVPTDSNQVVEYKVNVGGQLNIEVMGYIEEI